MFLRRTRRSVASRSRELWRYTSATDVDLSHASGELCLLFRLCTARLHSILHGPFNVYKL